MKKKKIVIKGKVGKRMAINERIFLLALKQKQNEDKHTNDTLTLCNKAKGRQRSRLL